MKSSEISLGIRRCRSWLLASALLNIDDERQHRKCCCETYLDTEIEVRYVPPISTHVQFFATLRVSVICSTFRLALKTEHRQQR